MVDKKKNLAKWVKLLYENKVTLKQAALNTGYHIGTLSRLKKKYAVYGNLIFEHGNKGKTPVNKISKRTRDFIINTYAQLYCDANWNFYLDILRDDYDIVIGYTTLYKILSAAGFKTKEAHKVKRDKVHRMRARKCNEGEMTQIDGSSHQWFLSSNNDHSYYTIHGAIDDATGKVQALIMTDNECLGGYLSMIQFMGDNNNLPLSIYSDRAAIFCKTKNGAANLSIQEQLEGLHESHTQWQKIMTRLNIKQILAWSPQAKGRIERLWRTLQGRLPLLFKKNKIKTIDAANKFLADYIHKYNERFAKNPKNSELLYLETPENLTEKLSLRFKRKTDASGVFSFDRYKFSVEGKNVSETEIEFCIADGELYAIVNNEKRKIFMRDKYNGISDNFPTVTEKFVNNYLRSYAKEICA